MQIGNVVCETPFVLAPLAGLTDSPMRRICRRRGASMVWTEMVSAEGLVRDGAKSFELLAFAEEERPIAFQLFGARPEAMAGAAAAAGALAPDVVDINVGCPAKSVVRGGAGSALMREPTLLREIASAVVEAAGRPVTAKIRSGWDDDSQNAVEVAALLEECGVSAVAVHPRTRAQGFRGSADWDVIREVASAVSIPVVGSGDVRTAEDALRMLETTACAAVMIGRGAVGNPWLFEDAETRRWTGRAADPRTLGETLATAIEHLNLMVESKGEHRGVLEMRKHLVAYLRGFHGASHLRAELVRIECHGAVLERLQAAVDEYTA
ncbi:MAG: tRNA dihydrouridine synthase DusB [Candidatus Eisenbacteria bacterium]